MDNLFDLRLRYNTDDDSGERDSHQSADMRLARNIAVALNKWYPGHPWMVGASHEQGVIYIGIPALSGDYRVCIKISTLKSDPGFLSVMRLVGEYLERFKLPRAGFSSADFNTALAAKPLGAKNFTEFGRTTDKRVPIIFR